MYFISAASGPIRLFTPYKRRRRNQITPDSSSTRTPTTSSTATSNNINNNNHNSSANQSYVTGSPAHKRSKPDEAKDDDEELSEPEHNHSILIAKEEPNWQTITEGLDVVSQDYLESTASTTTQSRFSYLLYYYFIISKCLESPDILQ